MTISRCHRGLGTVNIVNTLRLDVISVWIGGRTTVTGDSAFTRCVIHFYRATLCVSAVFAVARCPSLSVHHGALYPDGWRYRQTSFSARYAHHSSFLTPAPVPNSKGNPFSGAHNTQGGKNLRFSTEIAVYFGNGTTQAHGCYGTLIESHWWRIDTCQYRWPWVTHNPGFKVNV